MELQFDLAAVSSRLFWSVFQNRRETFFSGNIFII